MESRSTSECHLKSLKGMDHDHLNGDLKRMETLFDSIHFYVSMDKCTRCGQMYIDCHIEVVDCEYGEDSWDFYIPISEEELSNMRMNCKKPGSVSFKNIIDMISARSHITVDSARKFMCWSEECEPALVDAIVQLEKLS